MRYGAKTEAARRPTDPNLRSLSSLQHGNFAKATFVMPTRAYKTQEMRIPTDFSSSKFNKFMKSQKSAASCSRALIVLAVFSISGPLLAQSSSDWKAPPAAANRPNPLAGNANAIAAGQKLYNANCLTCHGSGGRGDGPGAAALEKRPADLVARIKSGETDGSLFWKISEGRSPMISWKASMSETQRWELVDYIKTLAGK
jgi:mono/diheme cytochrome c family protein